MTMKSSYSAVGVDVLLAIEDIVPIVYCLNTWKINDYSLVLVHLVSFLRQMRWLESSDQYRITGSEFQNIVNGINNSLVLVHLVSFVRQLLVACA